MANENSKLLKFLQRYNAAVDEYKGIEIWYVEVSPSDWQILLEDDGFRNYARKHKTKVDGVKMQYGNIGGREVKKGEQLKVHLESEQEQVKQQV